MVTEENVKEWLDEVKDPEIPVLSLIDLGVITKIDIHESLVKVAMTPTFVGCPAIDYMKNDIVEVLQKHGVKEVEVDVNFEQSWNSNKITQKGRKALKEFGLAPPPKHVLIVDLDILEH
ncbi:MAG: 1,2-phenylacetyl-CoA epoxidase subunit PaaD, partial [Bacteroidota bacterium]